MKETKATASSPREKRPRQKRTPTRAATERILYDPKPRIDRTRVGRGPSAEDLAEIPELPVHVYYRIGSILTWGGGGPKAQITLRLDKDILKWLRGKGPGYQTRLNLALRAMMLADQKAQARKQGQAKSRRA